MSRVPTAASRRRFSRLALGMALALSAGAASAQQDGVPAPQDTPYPGTITLDVEKPWHVYANPVGLDALKSTQTTVKFLTKVEDVKIEYPEGKLVKDDVVGDYKTYEGKVTIKATVKRAKGDNSLLELSVSLQACDKVCLLPATIKAKAN